MTDFELAVIAGGRLLNFFVTHPAAVYRFMLSIYAQMASRLGQINWQLLKVLAWGLRAHRIEKYLEGELDAEADGLSYAGKATG